MLRKNTVFDNNKTPKITQGFKLGRTNRKSRTTAALMCLLPMLVLQGCSYAPGLRVGDLGKVGQRTVEPVQDIPSYYTTGSGVKVRFVTLNHFNIPKQQAIPNTVKHSVRQLLNSKARMQAQGDYRISTGDTVSVNLWAYPEIFGVASTATTNSRNAFVVSQSGYIYLPLIGKVLAAGKTQAALRHEVSVRYSKFLKQPDVDLKVANFKGRSFVVRGFVKKPGEYVMSDKPATLMTALGQAGGLLENADTHKLTLQRRGRSYDFGLPELAKMGVATNDIYLQNGDTLVAHSNASRKVYLIGEAGRPVNITIPEAGLSLSNALGESQGVNASSANPAKIYVVRDTKAENLTELYRLDLSKLENLALANRFEMLPNDVVYIDATGLTRWNRILSLIVPSANAIRTGQTLGIK